MPESPISSQFTRIAVILPTWVGDVVMSTPVLRAMRCVLPEAEIIALMRPGLDDVLAGNPWCSHTLVHTMRGVAGPLRAGRLLHSYRPEAVLLLPNSPRSAITAWCSGAGHRVGYDRDGRGRLLTHRLAVERHDRPTPTIDYYTRLAEWALGTSIDGRAPELFTSPDDEQAADQLLAECDMPFALLNPGASKVKKRWPAERFIATARALQKSDLAIVINGSPGEAELTATIAQEVDGAIDLASRGVTLRSLKSVVRRARLLITNDTGPRHLAAAFGTPTVSIFGPTDHRWTSTDLRRERVVLAEPFLPDDQVADQYERVCDITRIPAGDVIALAEELLAMHPRQQESSNAR